jgi:ligand-binding sensor domain-containing protein
VPSRRRPIKEEIRRVPLDGPPPGVVTALAPRGDTLWVGTFDRGLSVMTRRGRWRRIRSPDDRITALQVGPRGRVWVGTATGLLRQSATNPLRLSPVRDPDGWLGRHVSTLRRHGDRLWVGVYPGLVAIDVAAPPGDELDFEHLGASGHAADAGLVGPTVYGAAFGGDSLWVGTEDGLSLLAGSGQGYALTDLGGVLPDNWITDVRRAGAVVHVLTLRSGLLQLTPRGSRLLRFNLMTSPSGMLALRRAVVFGTNRQGLALVRGARRITTYGPERGLASSAVAALAYDVAADRLWVGGNAGVDQIDGALQRIKEGI